jgi:NTP pyrophosphatase (non-canonical NTP hydrolase)
MRVTEYAGFVASRAKLMGTPLLDRLHAAVGVAGEAGELLDAIKRTWVYNEPLDGENVLEECGDVLFYIQAQLNVTGLTLHDAIEHNVAKLHKRYPDGYTDAAAQARADKALPASTNSGPDFPEAAA